MQKIAVIHLGHSHLAAATPFLFHRPLDEPHGALVEHYVFNIPKFNIYAIDGTRFGYSVRLDGALQVNPVVRKFIETRIAPDRTIVFSTMMGGNTHNAMLLLQPERHFDFVLPCEPDLPLQPGAEVVPFDAVKGVMRVNSQLYLDDLAGLAASYDSKIYHVVSPPPIEDDAEVKKVIDFDPYFRQMKSTTVSPALTRYKAWVTHTQIYSDVCKELGIEVLMPPPDAVVAGKWLAQDCVGADPTHGNLTYSGHVFRMIERANGGTFAGWDWLG